MAKVKYKMKLKQKTKMIKHYGNKKMESLH